MSELKVVPSEGNPNAEKARALQARYPGRRICRVALKSTGQEFWIVAPDRTAWHTFKAAAKDKMRMANAYENFAVACAIEPAPAQLGEMYKTQPALAEFLSVKLTELAGYEEEAEFEDFPLA